ncbi:MAG TPA: D-alanine--D-alanine ligase family protein [Gaiellaceae bacterium]|nr:D-alanine--D-alanine ligase family protein [Gaiellaceae bacterium]
MSRRLRVALLAGGRSSEHEISLASARSVMSALDPARYDVTGIQIGRDGRWAVTKSLQSVDGDVGVLSTHTSSSQLVPSDDDRTPAVLGSVDVVLPILHGPFGEDGTVQGLLELLDVAYVGAGVAASALAMDKDLFKKVMRDSGIPVARHHTIRLGDAVENPLGYPVLVKPARLGSSVGISKVLDASELEPAVALARRHDEKVLVEEFVEGLEVEVGVLGNRVPPPIASLPGSIDTLDHDWYDYSSKYDEDGMRLVVPPDLPPETIELVQQRAVDAFVASECEGLARVDFFVRARDGEVVVNELNTMPGFTATSVYAKLFEASGIGYAELVDRLIALALERHERRARLEY